MSLVYKSSVRENVTDIQTYIVDDSPKSTKYFRVSDVPQVLQKGKNLLRITAHPTNLVPGTQVYVDVRDSNGNAIYYEIPDYLEDDKSRVISIWIYHDKGDDNTPNGEATITLAGIANVDMDGNPLPSRHRDKINVKWQTTVTVDRERSNTSEVIFNSTNLPIVSVSQSIEQYQNQPQDGEGLNLTSQTGKVQYIFRGETPIIEIKDSSTFNSEMVDGSIILNNFSEPAEPINKLANPLSSTFFSSSIKEVLTNKVLKTATNFTTSFENRTDVIHTFNRISEADYKIEYFKTGSNISTENKRNFANLTFSNVDPITGVVDKIKVLQKSDGLPGEFELLNEVSVPFSSSFDIKVPIPSKNLKDPKILKLLYLNSEGGISRTETISKPFVFDGDNVYIGGSENLISGSIFISNTLGTGIEIGGASSGFIRSVGFEGQTSASIGEAPGGFVIYSGSGNLVMGVDQLNGVGMQFIGDNDDRHLIFTTDNGGILDVKTDKFFVGTSDTQFISGSDGNIEISSSIFHLDPAANGGDGSLIIGANATILSDLTVDNLRTPATIDGVASTEANSSSSIKADGFARFVSASVGGWDITTASIEGGNLLMKPEGILQTRDFASGLKGWKISSEGNGTAEFENIRIRGTLRTTTFEKESVNAVGGQLWVANSTTITGSVGLSDTTMSVKNASGFSAGEILLIKKVNNTGFQTEYVLLNSASIDGDGSNEDEQGGRIMVTRAYGSGSGGDFVGDLASTSQSYDEGQVIVSTGKLNTGYIKMNANPNDTATPFIDIVERTGSGLYDVALKARLGDLSGLANSTYVFGNSNPGFGLATDNVYLQGGIIANTGSIGGIEMDGGKLFTGGGNYNNSDTGFYVDSGSQFSLGTKLVWNPTTEALVIRGQLQLSDGTDVGTAIENVSTPTGSVARVVSLAADKYVVTFDADGNENPSGQTITLTATPQNFGTATVYYEFYKDSTIQGSRSTTATFDVNTSLEKPTATSPVTYEVRTFTGSDGGTSISSDSLTLFGIQPGSDGTDGVDAVTAFLTNESHTLPLSSSGDVTSYAGADTLMKVFEGITDSSSNYTYTVSTPSHITATSSSNSVTITATTTPHSGSVTITAASSSVSLAKTMSIAVARQGDDGADGNDGLNGSNAKTLVASVDSQVFAFDDSTDNSATPSSILFSFSQQNLSGTIAASDITITTDDSNSVTNFSFDNNSVSNGSGIVSGSVSYTGGFSSGGLNGSKDSLPLTISCTKDSLTDSIKVFKVEGGSDGAAGADGSDAVTAFLTNESHTLPAQNDGTVVSFAGATTDMEVFEGITNKTNVYTFSRTSATSVSSSISDNTVTVTSMAHDSGSIVITATSASVSLSKTMTLSKSKQGTAGLAGSDAKLLTLTSDSQVFAFPSASSSTAIDNDILIIVNQQNLSGTIGAGDITIKDTDGNTLSDPTFVANVTDGTGQVSGSITFSGTVAGDKTKLPLTIEVSKDSLEDSLKIFKVEGGSDGSDGADGTNGTDAITVILSNESHTLPADSGGNIASFSGAETDVTIFEGVTDKTTNYFINGVSNTGVSFDNDFNSFNSSSLNITAMAHDSGSVIITSISGGVPHTGYGARAGENWDSSQFVTNNQGDINGTDNDFYYQSHPTYTVTGSGDGELRNNYVEFGDNAGNDQVWIVGKDIVAYDDTKTYYVEARFKRINGSGNVFIGVNGWANETTKVNINGANSFGGQHYIAASTFNFDDGEGTDWITMRGYFSGHSSTAGQLSGEAPDINNPKKIHTNATYISPLFLANHDGAAGKVRLDYIEIKEVKDGSGNLSTGTVKVDKTMSLTKARQGSDGSDGTSAKLLIGSLDSPVFSFLSASDNSAEPSNIIFSFQQQNLNASIGSSDITITTADGDNVTGFSFDNNDVSNGTGVVSGSVTFSGALNAGGLLSEKSNLPLTISCTKDSITDSVKIFKVEGGTAGAAGADGVNAVTAILTNDSHTLPVSSSGNVISFAGASTDIIVFEGTTDVTNNYTISRTSDSHITTTLSDDTVTITNSTTPFSGSVTITAASASVSLAKTMSISQALQGDDGADGAPGSNAKIITLTSDSQVYTFASASVTTPDDNTIELFFNQQNLSGTIAASDVTITDQLGTTHTVPTLSPSSLSNGTGVVSGSLVFSTNTPSNKTKFPITISVTKDGVTDSTKIFTLDGGSDGADGAAGADAYTVILSNESHTIPQASAQSGGARDFTGSGTNIVVYKGTTELQHTTSTPGTEEFKVTATGTDITPGSITNPSRPAVVADHSSMTADSASISYSINVENSATFTKLQSFTTSQTADSGSDGAQGATGPEGPNFDFLSGSLDTVNTTGGLSAGLLMTSNVFGFHGPIAQGDGTNAQLSDFTSFLDSGGSFYLGGNSSGMSGSAATSGYLAWNNTDRSLLISGSNANIQVEKFFVGNSTTQFVSGSNGNLEISGSNFHLDSSGNVKVSGEITVTNTADFAGNSWIDNFNNTPTETNYYSGNVTTVLATTSDAGNTFDGIKVNNSSYYGGAIGGFITKTTFAKANEPTFVIDVILNDGNGPGNRTFERHIGSVGFTDVAAIGDITTTSNLDHLMAGFRFHSEEFDADYYNQISIYDNGSVVRTYSQETGNQLNADEPWTEGTDTKWRFTIKLLAGGGATYRAYKNGDFVTPIMTHTTSTNIGTDLTAGVLVEMASAALDFLYVENMSVGAGLPQSTTISGNAISTGKIQSTTLTSTAGSELDLDGALFKIGGTGAYTSNNGILMDGPNARFAVGNSGGSYIRFNHTAEKLEINADNFKVKASGEVTASGLLIDGSAQIADTVQIGGSSDGTVIFFDDFTTYATLESCITASDDPKTDGSGQGYHLVDYDGLADTSLLSGQSDTFNNNGGLLRIGDNSGDDVIWASSNSLIPINASSLYEYEIRLRKPAASGGTDGQYVGFTVYNSDGTTKRSQNDTDVFGSAHYFVLSNTSIGTNFETHRGFIKGFGDAASTVSTTKTTPTVFQNGAENGYFAPMFLVNWNGQAGQVEIDYIKVTEYAQGGGSSRISGDTITTGTIKSNNLNADSGSQILLNDGSMKMGGTASPGFEVTTEGFVTATNLVEKMVEVSADNSSSYFEYYDSNKTRILLDGSGGGDVTMNLTLGVAPEYIIHDIQFPGNTTGLDIAKLELTIATTESVQFDENTISSGFFSFGLSLSSKSFGGSLA